MLLRVSFFLLIFLHTSSLIAEPASLSAVDTAVIGADVSVEWQAPGENYDSVYIVKPDAPDDTKGIHSATVLNKRNPVKLTMPDVPGSYEIRYWSRADKAILARTGISITDVPSSLDAVDTAVMGSSIEVTWQGPGNQYDQIVLVEVGAPEDARGAAKAGIVSKRNPVTLHLPDQAGDYELRYVTRQSRRVLARRPFSVTSVTATLKAPQQASIGSTIDVSWEGPGNQYDRIAVYPATAADDAKPVVSASIVSKRNPVSIRLPEQAGQYELRYQTAKSGAVLGRKALTIGSVETTLEAPEQATAGTMISIAWKGPGNNYDQIGLFSPEAPDDAKPTVAQSILNKRNPVPLKLPFASGDFELRYRTTQDGVVLAKKRIRVEPAGRLAVAFETNSTNTHSAVDGSGAVELILDASGSMLQRVGGETRIEIARKVLSELVSDHLSDGQLFALRVFGHKEAGKCRTDLEIPLSAVDWAAALNQIKSVSAMNLAKTPIADSLAKVPSDLAKASGPKSIILITDGEETCEGDPAAVIAKLRDSGLNVQLSIVGFAIEDKELKETFENWAALGGGSYFDARSADELMQSLRTVISGPFQVMDKTGATVAKGVIGGAPVVVPAGVYTVATLSAKPRVIENVTVRPDELTTATF